MVQKKKIILLCFGLVPLLIAMSACLKDKENLSPQGGGTNPYGGKNGRIYLYFTEATSVPASLSVDNKTSVCVNNYWPNGPDNCDSPKAQPSFTLTEGYHTYRASFGNRSYTGTFYLRRGECSSLQMD